jgi:hypothetical protein
MVLDTAITLQTLAIIRFQFEFMFRAVCIIASLAESSTVPTYKCHTPRGSTLFAIAPCTIKPFVKCCNNYFVTNTAIENTWITFCIIPQYILCNLFLL